MFVALIVLVVLYLLGQTIGPSERVTLTVAGLDQNRSPDDPNRISFDATSSDGEEFEITSDQYEELSVGAAYDCEAKGFGFFILKRALRDCVPAD